MKQTLYTVLFAAMVIAAFSCSKQDVEIVKTVPATIKATASDVSKTSVAGDGTYSWVAGDEISVFIEDGTQCPSSFVAQSSDKSSEFTGSKNDEGDVLKYAVYPYDSNATCTDAGIISTRIPTEQDGTIASAISVGTSSDGSAFSFSNVCSIVAITFQEADDIHYFRMEFPAAVSGDVDIDCSNGEITGATARTVSITSNVALSGTKYIAIAPCAKGKVVLYFRNGDGDCAFKTATLTKAFSVNTIKNIGTASGLSFIEGALPGRFSRQGGTTYYTFSKGNLRYLASSDMFSFASNQYTVLGPNVKGNNESSVDNRSTQSYWIDLFCWGTSGYDYGAVKYQPWSIWGATGTDCGNGNVALSGNMDWGYNAISNGGNTENYGWSTPSVGDWNYLKGTVPGRTTNEFTKGTVAGVKGIIFIPDVWTCPADVAEPTSYNSASVAWTSNEWTAADWAKLENSGLVFIPCGGWIGTGGGLNGEGTQFKVWSKSNFSENAEKAYLLTYSNGVFISNDTGTRSSQASVRLIYIL